MNLSNISGISKIFVGLQDCDLNALEMEMKCKLPMDYRELLQITDGIVLSNGVLIYSSEDVEERNTTFEVANYAHGYLAIGDDSGGRAILTSLADGGIFLVDQGSMDIDDSERIAGRCLSS